MYHTINILLPNEIDVAKWDALVSKVNAPIYCTYNFINSLSQNWKALVVNDYELVLPIPYKTKLTIPYAYSVPFIQQLGFIGNLELIQDIDLIKKHLKKVVKLGEIYANYKNQFLIQKEKGVIEKLNLILPLHKNYEELQNGFSKDALRNIAKAEKQRFVYSKEVPIKTAVDLYKEHYGSKMKNIAAQDYINFENLCYKLQKEGNCFTRALWLDNQLLSCTIILKDDSKLYNIANTTTIEGKKLSANYFLFQQLFKEFSNTNLVFDFEGSEIAGVKKFYQGFGALPQPYFMWKFNFLKPSFVK